MRVKNFYLFMILFMFIYGVGWSLPTYNELKTACQTNAYAGEEFERFTSEEFKSCLNDNKLDQQLLSQIEENGVNIQLCREPNNSCSPRIVNQMLFDCRKLIKACKSTEGN